MSHLWQGIQQSFILITLINYESRQLLLMTAKEASLTEDGSNNNHWSPSYTSWHPFLDSKKHVLAMRTLLCSNFYLYEFIDI